MIDARLQHLRRRQEQDGSAAGFIALGDRRGDHKREQYEVLHGDGSCVCGSVGGTVLVVL